jgi:hypothetical protein
MKKWLLKNQPQEVAGSLPPVQTVQPLLEMAPGTMHIHPTHLVGVKGWAESQVLWCNAHNVQVGV